MEEILSYRLSDLLLFSEQTYHRQFALFNQWLGPYRYLAYLYVPLFLHVWRRPGSQLTRGLIWLTALYWLICVIGFLNQFYAQINWMVGYLLPVLGIQPILLIWLGTRSPKASGSYPALLLLGIALLQPLLELTSGRSSEALSAYALTPDTLAINSLALMFLLRQATWWFLPTLLWLVFSFLTYLAMGSPMYWPLLLALLLTVISRLALRYTHKPG